MKNHQHPGSFRAIGSAIVSRLILAALIIGLALPTAILAQSSTGSIEGRILNVGNGRYLNNARVTIPGTNIESFTDEYGAYRIENVPAGEVPVTAGYTGLDTETTTVTVTAGQATTRNFDLTSKERYGEEKTLQLDTFVVASQRDYEGDALSTNEQRFASNLKVVVSSDSFGSINEGNPGEFLKYLPGITVDYVASDVRTVSVRGFSSQFTNVYWDGMRMTSSASGTSNRVFEFEQVSINNTSRSEVTKVPTPEMPADSLGGTINFVSKNAFERRGAQFNYRFYFNINDENVDLSKTPGPGQDATWKVLPSFDFDYTIPINDRLGLVVTGLSSNQYVEQHRWQTTWNYAQAGATPTNPYLQQWQLQDGPKTTNRASIGIKADWKVTDTQVLSVAFQDNYYKAYFGNRNVNFNMGTSATPVTSGSALAYGPDFVMSATGRGSVTQSSAYRDKLGNTQAIKLNYTFKSGDWTATAGAAHTKSKSWYRALGRGHFAEVGTTFQGVSTVRADNIKHPELTWVARDSAGVDMNTVDLSNYRIGTLRDNPLDGIAILDEVKFDVEKQFGLAFPLSIKVGGDVRVESRDNRRYQNDYTFLGADGVANTADDVARPYLDTSYLDQDPYWGYQSLQWASPTLLAQQLITNPGYFRLGTGTAATGVQAETFRIDNSEFIEEKISAAFIQFDGQLMNNKLRFLTGVRYEKTLDKGIGRVFNADAVWQKTADGSDYVDGNPALPGIQRVRKPEAGAVGSMEELRVTRQERADKRANDYDGFYPSLHLTYNITDDILLRFAYAKTIGRPDYANIIPLTDINEDDSDPSNPGTITLRNINLRPWTADNYDLSVEYYMKKGGLASFGVFQKDLSDFWTVKSGPMTQADLDTYGLDSQYLNWIGTSTQNGGTAQIQGVEINLIQPLSFLPGWGKYFTIKANGTKLKLSGSNSPDFRGFIEETGNLNLAFNKSPYSFNLTFNYRGLQIGTSGTAAFAQTGAQYGSTTGFKEYFAPRTFVDFSGEYQLTKNLSIFGGVRNLFNKEQMIRRYNDNSPDYAQNYRQEEFGIACSIGIKGTF